MSEKTANVAMNELETFHLDLYYAKLQLPTNGSGFSLGLWNEVTQKNIDALSHLCQAGIEVEAYIIAAKNYFREKISYPEIIEIIKACCKSQVDPSNKHAFTNAFFNRLKLHVKE